MRESITLTLISFILGCGVGGQTLLSAYDRIDASHIRACASERSCLTRLVQKKIETHGLPAGFFILREIYISTPSFRPHCHEFAQGITKRYASTTPFFLHPILATCNFGFFQQYPQSLLEQGHMIDEVKQFCDDAGSRLYRYAPAVTLECYRSIGRGLPETYPSLFPDQIRIAESASETCETIAPSPITKASCVSGVFNTLAQLAIRKSHGLSIRTDDPLYVCSAQSDIARQGHCLGNYKNAVVSLVPIGDGTVTEEYLRDLYSDDDRIRPTLWAIGYEWGRTKGVAGADFTEGITLCATLSAEYIASCVGGISVGLIKHGIPFAQHLRMTEFCKMALTHLSSVSTSDCPERSAVEYIAGLHTHRSFVRIVEYMETELGVAFPEEWFEKFNPDFTYLKNVAPLSAL